MKKDLSIPERIIRADRTGAALVIPLALSLGCLIDREAKLVRPLEKQRV